MVLGRPGLISQILIERRGEYFLDSLDQNKRQVVPHFLRHFFQVLFIRLGKNDPFNPCAMSGQHLLLDPADRQD